MDEQISDLKDVLSELLEDNTVPKNVKNIIDTVIRTLDENSDLSLRINKALNMLDEIADDNNIQPYTRTQIWNIVSMLESINS